MTKHWCFRLHPALKGFPLHCPEEADIWWEITDKIDERIHLGQATDKVLREKTISWSSAFGVNLFSENLEQDWIFFFK
jgi:hypothetical protein